MQEVVFFLVFFFLLQGHKAAKFPLRVSAIKQAAPSEMQRSYLTSSEAGLAFPLSRLSVFDLGPLSPNRQGRQHHCSRCSHFVRRCERPCFTGGPLNRTLRLHQRLSQPAPPSATRVAAHAHTETLIHTYSFSCFT